MATVMPELEPPKRPPIWNVPNMLTTARFFLALILFGLIHYHLWIAALGVFALAALTDYLDGYLARLQGLTSTLGRNLDPLVDKVLVCGAFTFLLVIPETGLEPWMIVVVVARELIITSLRSFLENEGVRFGADWLGKVKMALQCAALIALFLALWHPLPLFQQAAVAMTYAMLIATALSGLQYLLKAAALLKR